MYNDALARFDGQIGLNLRLDGPCGSHIVWVIANPVHGSAWSSSQVDMVARVLPHLAPEDRFAHRGPERYLGDGIHRLRSGRAAVGRPYGGSGLGASTTCFNPVRLPARSGSSAWTRHRSAARPARERSPSSVARQVTTVTHGGGSPPSSQFPVFRGIPQLGDARSAATPYASSMHRRRVGGTATVACSTHRQEAPEAMQ